MGSVLRVSCPDSASLLDNSAASSALWQTTLALYLPGLTGVGQGRGQRLKWAQGE